jgi:glycosyltransferase involved in cell wall biosynthesis
MQRGVSPQAAPLVSVVVPSFNHREFLRDCIDSVLEQDYGRFEVIVVDDGSTDGSVELLRSYGDRITLLHQQRGRQARARNLGLREARGDLISFLDSDDRYLPGRISAAVQAFVADPAAAVVWGDYRLIDGDGTVTREVRWTPREADFRHELIRGNPICNATVTLRRSVLDEIGGFDERVPRVCDGAAWYQIAARGHRFHHLDRLLLDYRIHGANDSSRFAPMTRDRDNALLDAAQAYVQRGIVATPSEKQWLRDALIRQFSFRAAAWMQRDLAPGPLGSARARIYDGLGSDRSLRIFARIQHLKRMWIRQ